jgi:hypothetical protein
MLEEGKSDARQRAVSSKRQGETMHIHGGQLNPSQSASATQGSEAARRADATRKKLLDSASQLQALSGGDTDAAWIIQAWGGNQSSANQNPQGNQQPAGDSVKPSEADSAVTRSASSGPVSFWA